jgi:hypothetical protein
VGGELGFDGADARFKLCDEVTNLPLKIGSSGESASE